MSRIEQEEPLTMMFRCEGAELQRQVLDALTAAGFEVTPDIRETTVGSGSDESAISLRIRKGAGATAVPIGYNSPVDPDLFQASMNSIDQGMVVFDPDFKIIFSNPKFTELAEFPEELGKPGTSIADGLRHDADRGVYGPGDPEQIVSDTSMNLPSVIHQRTAGWWPTFCQRPLM